MAGKWEEKWVHSSLNIKKTTWQQYNGLEEDVMFIIISQAKGLKEQSDNEGGQGKKNSKNYTEGKIFLVINGISEEV